MEKINYQFDFKVQEFSRVNFAVIPFKFTYYTEENWNVYVASYNWNEYVNCVKKDDYNVIVSFDNHNLNPSTIKVLRDFFITDSEYADGEAHIKEYDRCGIILVKDGVKVCKKLCYTSEIRPNFNNDFSNYYTKEETDIKIDKIIGGDINLQNYPTKSEVTTQIQEALSSYEPSGDYVTNEELENKGYLTELPEDLITENELTERGYINMSDVESKGYITSIPQEYVTETELNSKGYLTEHQSLEEYYTKTEVDSKLGNIDTLLTEILW